MNELQLRKTQTAVKHIILEQYLQHWGSIITMGLRSTYKKATAQGWPFSITLAYIDPFAYQGLYRDSENTNIVTYGSPIIGIRTLDNIRDTAHSKAGFTPDVVSILIEIDKNNFEILLGTLKRLGYQNRLRINPNLTSLENGDIAVIHGDLHKHAASLLSFTARKYLKALFFLDPFGPSGIPLSIVRDIISRQGNDTIINYPYLTVQRGLQPEHITNMYGSEIWKKANQKQGCSRENCLVEDYIRILQGCDQELAIKYIPLMFPDKDRTIFDLILTTYDPTGALAMNEILDNAKLREYELRIRWQSEKYTKRTGQLSLFSEDAFQSTTSLSRPQIDEIAGEIYSQFEHRTALYRDVLRSLVNSPYYHKEIRKAMTQLKKAKQVEYPGSLTHDTMVKFN